MQCQTNEAAETQDKDNMPSKPTSCPECKDKSVAAILWGMPAFDDELEKGLEEGIIVLGGCCVSEDYAKWHCNACGHEWGHIKRQ